MAERKFELPAPKGSAPKGGARKVYKSREYTEAEQAKMLANYFLLDKGQWQNLRSGDNIRYVTTSDEFRRGGLVDVPSFKNPKATKDPDRLYISMRGGLGPKAPSWVVAWDTIQEVYVGPPASLLVMKDRLEENALTVDGYLRKLVAYLEAQQKRIVALERDVALLKGGAAQ